MGNNKEYKLLSRIYLDMICSLKKRLIMTQMIAIILSVAFAAVFLFVSHAITLQMQQPEQLSVKAPTERCVGYDRTYTNQAADEKHSRYKDV
jgi:hypothetical protein